MPLGNLVVNSIAISIANSVVKTLTVTAGFCVLLCAVNPVAVQAAAVQQSTAQKQTEQEEVTERRKASGKSPLAKQEQDLARLRPDEPERVSPGQLEMSIERGSKHLVETQRADGAWGGPQWTGGVDSDPVGSMDAFDVAITAMCLEAMLDVEQSAEVVAANKKALEFLLEDTDGIRRADGGNLPHIWSHCYCIQTFTKIHQRSSDEMLKTRLEDAIETHVAGLDRWQSINGGWFYYGNGMAKPTNPSCSFVNAAILIALSRARDAGMDVNDKMVAKALRATQLMRKPDSSFLYTAGIPGDMSNAMSPINRPAGSLGRSQAGNAALRAWSDEDITDEVLTNWLNRLITRHGWLEMGRKRRVPHVAPAAVAGYFYYFGMYYGSVCIEFLPSQQQEFYQLHLAKLIMERQEKDGSWFDYPLYSYHKPYGTAFAMLALQRCRFNFEK